MPGTLPAAIPSRTVWRAAVEACFYGHLFYGVCAVAQIAETSVQLALPVNGWLMTGAFVGTVMFYSYPYSRQTATGTDPRVVWHQRHRDLVARWQLGGLLTLLALLVWMVMRHGAAILSMTPLEWFGLLVFPYVGGLYYGAPVMWPSTKLRHSGWLKPFVIGFVWAGVVVAAPIPFARLQYGHQTPLALFPALLFVRTLMFVAVLAMLFDIKDREADERVGLSTVATLVGLERTIFQVSLPLTVLGVVTFLSYATVQHLTLPRVLFGLAPFGLLVAGIISLRRPRSILYYLTVIDGLMLAKAVLDIVAFQF